MRRSVPEDLVLIQAMQAGDLKGLRGLYRRYGEVVYRLALRILDDPQDATETTQDVFLNLWRTTSYQPSRNRVLVYLLTITRAQSINRLRQTQSRPYRHQRWLIEYPSRASVLQDLSLEHNQLKELTEQVEHALDHLSDQQRQVIELAYYDGMSQSEIMVELQLPLGTVKANARQGLLHLRQLLTDWPYPAIGYADIELLEDPEQIELLLAGYALGNLTSEEVIQYKRLLEENPELAPEVECLQATLSLLPLSLPVTHRMPSDLEDKILQLAQTDITVVPVVTPQPPSPQRLSKPWRMVLIGVTAFTISFLGIRAYQLEQEVKTLQVNNQQLQRSQRVLTLLREPNKRFITMQSTMSGSRASGSLMVVPHRNLGLMGLQQVDPLPDENVYRLWAVVNGQPVFCADFKPNSHGEVLLEVPFKKWSMAAEVIVTVEPKPALSQPTGEAILRGN
jgi:RNA polymerase sigma-70 factor, ECF subfamily